MAIYSLFVCPFYNLPCNFHYPLSLSRSFYLFFFFHFLSSLNPRSFSSFFFSSYYFPFLLPSFAISLSSLHPNILSLLHDACSFLVPHIYLSIVAPVSLLPLAKTETPVQCPRVYTEADADAPTSLVHEQLAGNRSKASRRASLNYVTHLHSHLHKR